MNETIATFGYPDTLIKEFDHWVVLLRPEQITVGSLVLAAKSGVKHLGQLSPEVWAEFDAVTSYAEELLKETFNADKFNYLALMMKDPNVHFHFIPRYSKPVSVAGREYIDPDWPFKTECIGMDITTEEFTEIKTRLLR